MRLIDADKLISEFALRVYNIRNNSIMYEHPKSVLWALDVSIKEIEHAPTIESESVRHGEWIDTGIEELDLIYSGYKCSQCGFILCGNQTKYCPGCGAKMDKKSPENHKKYQEEETNKKAFK